MTDTSSYTVVALKMLLQGKAISSIPNAKNSNQYFGIIKNHGIELVEVPKPNLNNARQHKERSLFQTKKNIERAEKCLARLQGIRHKKGV